LEDPEKSGVSVVTIAAVSALIVVFLVIFGVLQFRSKKQYSRVSVDEEDTLLLNGTNDSHEESTTGESIF